MNFKITSISVIMAIDPLTGDEGVWGFKSDGHLVPMVCADEERLSYIYPIAIEMSKEIGVAFRVLQFDGRKDITEAVAKLYS